MAKVQSIYLNNDEEKMLENLCVACNEPNESAVMKAALYQFANGGNKANAESDDGLKLDLPISLRAKAMTKRILEEQQKIKEAADQGRRLAKWIFEGVRL
jgi:hypothetical protein